MNQERRKDDRHPGHPLSWSETDTIGQAAAAPQAVAGKGEVPEGWKLVPLEPTEDMITAGFESWPDAFFDKPEDWEAFQAMTGCQQAAHKARMCYGAMLAASPAAPDIPSPGAAEDRVRAFLEEMTQLVKDMNGSYWIPRAVKLLASLSSPAERQEADTCAQMRALCSACGGTGTVHRPDGEYVGDCDCAASPASAEPVQGLDEAPSVEQEWAKVDPVTALHLIDRHADDWADAGRMMLAWRDANPAPATKTLIEAMEAEVSDLRARLATPSSPSGENDLLSMKQVKAIIDSIKPGDGWGGDDWDFALANAVAAHMQRRAAPSSPSVSGTVDKPEFRKLLNAAFAHRGADGGKETTANLIAHIDQHTAQAVRAAREEALEEAEQAIERLAESSGDAAAYDHREPYPHEVEREFAIEACAKTIRTLRTPQSDVQGEKA